MGDAVKKLNYSHDAIIDLVIANPWITQNELAAKFGYTPTWVSMVMSSDVFKARLAQRKADIIDPGIIQTLEEKFESIVRQSAQVVMDKLGANPTGEFALKALNVAGKALGLGQQKQQPTAVQNNYVVMLPPKAKTASEWMERHAPKTIDPADPEGLGSSAEASGEAASEPPSLTVMGELAKAVMVPGP